MAPLERIAPDFVPLTSISSSVMDSELNQILTAVNELRALVGIDGAPTLDADNLAAAFVADLAATQFFTGDLIHTRAAGKSGWLACDGAAVSRTTYAALFALLGTSEGPGDGSTTFNLPDYRGRTLIGLGTHADVDALTDNDGLVVGSRTPNHAHVMSAHTHTVPNHQHVVIVSGSTGDANGAVGGGTTYATTANPSATPHHHDVTLGGTTAVDGGGSGVQTGQPSTPNTSTAATPHGVANIFIKV